MTEQDHINAIGEAITDVEEANEDLRRTARRVTRSVRRLHDTLEAAQAAHIKATGGNVVAFSGGTNKPPVDDPDEPIEPLP